MESFRNFVALLLMGFVGIGFGVWTEKSITERSVAAVSVYLDADTGCEYLLTWEGHITPRTASDSYHGQSGCRGRFMGME